MQKEEGQRKFKSTVAMLFEKPAVAPSSFKIVILGLLPDLLKTLRWVGRVSLGLKSFLTYHP